MVTRMVRWATFGLLGLGGCTAIVGIDTNYKEVECLDSASCGGTRPICGAENTCLKCSSSHPCSAGQVCQADGSCGPCADRSDCATGQICSDGACTRCGSKADCEVEEECKLGECKLVPCSADKATCEGDSGFCETDLTAPETCGSCDHACSSDGVVASSLVCTGTSCSFACAAARHDCNANSADGCECSGSGCCPEGDGEVCMSAHHDGVSPDPFFDCRPVADHSQYGAQRACENYAGGAGSCQQRPLGNNEPHICAPESQTCTCWAYEEFEGARKTAGHVSKSADANCQAATTADPAWD